LEGGTEPSGRVRAPGGGRKRASEADPGLSPALTALVDPQACGDPESPLVWTTQSTKALAAAGHVVSDRTVARMLRAQGFACRPTPRSPRVISTPAGTLSSADHRHDLHGEWNYTLAPAPTDTSTRCGVTVVTTASLCPAANRSRNPASRSA
jgi:hypothetical protein